MSLKKKLLGAVLWSSFGGVISRGSMLFAFIIVARILGQETYGEFSIIRSTVNMFVIFAGFGLGVTATKHIAEFKTSNPKRASRILTLSSFFSFVIASFIAVLVYVYAPWLAQNTINAPHLESELRIGALILWISSINGAQTGALIGFEAFRRIAKINVFVGVVSAISVMLGAYVDSLHGVVVALLFNVFIAWLINHFALRKEAKKYRISFFSNDWWEERSILWRFSLPATLGGLMVSPIVWLCNTMLVNQPNGFYEMGLVDVSNQWFMAILFVPSLVGKVVLPMLSNLNGNNKKKQYKKILKYSLAINGVAALIIAIIVSWFSPLIMKSYGSDFKEGYLVLIYFSISAVFVSINNVLGQVITSRGKMWTGLCLNLLWAIAMLAFSWYFITHNSGAEGLAIAYLCSYAIHSCWQLIYISFFLNLEFNSVE